ncbi:MAG: hypothetical protein HGB00_05775 [Chlorobiaceae bacterium]|nr:hypothetical protein [Chlorobiaceae bacterium]
MAEQIVTGYKKLFEVRLLHHYWLDDGAMAFDRISGQKKEELLMAYDVQAFIDIAPAEETKKLMTGLGCIWRNTPTGFIAAIAGEANLPSDIMFEFILKVRSGEFFNYTAMTLFPQTVRELYSEKDNSRIRFKENVPVFSNVTGAARGTGEDKTLFLSREIPALKPSDRIESIIDKDGALYLLTTDQAAPGMTGMLKLEDDKTLLPVFANQDDVPEIVPPEGIAGAPGRGVGLTAGIPEDTFALVRLCPVREDDDDFSFADGSGLARSNPPVFHVRFKNRLTWWKHIDRNRTETMSAEPLPLTFSGNASGTKKKPSAGLVKAEKESGGNITRLVSEIFE